MPKQNSRSQDQRNYQLGKRSPTHKPLGGPAICGIPSVPWSVHSTVLLQFVRCRSNLAATADLAPPRMRTQMPQIPCTLSTMMDTDSYAEDTDWQFVAI